MLASLAVCVGECSLPLTRRLRRASPLEHVTSLVGANSDLSRIVPLLVQFPSSAPPPPPNTNPPLCCGLCRAQRPKHGAGLDRDCRADPDSRAGAGVAGRGGPSGNPPEDTKRAAAQQHLQRRRGLGLWGPAQRLSPLSSEGQGVCLGMETEAVVE